MADTGLSCERCKTNLFYIFCQIVFTWVFRLTDYTGSTEFPLVSPDEMIMESTTGDMMYKELFSGSKVLFLISSVTGCK